jgi:hypothetical protein
VESSCAVCCGARPPLPTGGQSATSLPVIRECTKETESYVDSSSIATSACSSSDQICSRDCQSDNSRQCAIRLQSRLGISVHRAAVSAPKCTHEHVERPHISASGLGAAQTVITYPHDGHVNCETNGMGSGEQAHNSIGHDLSGEIGGIYNVKENAIIHTTVILECP